MRMGSSPGETAGVPPPKHQDTKTSNHQQPRDKLIPRLHSHFQDIFKRASLNTSNATERGSASANIEDVNVAHVMLIREIIPRSSSDISSRSKQRQVSLPTCLVSSSSLVSGIYNATHQAEQEGNIRLCLFGCGWLNVVRVSAS